MIKVGDLVVCINAGFIDGFDPKPFLKRGVAYRVIEVEGVYISIEPAPTNMAGGWYAKRFIKVEV